MRVRQGIVRMRVMQAEVRENQNESVRKAGVRDNASVRKAGVRDNASEREAGVRDNASEREAGLLRGSTAYCCCYHLC